MSILSQLLFPDLSSGQLFTCCDSKCHISPCIILILDLQGSSKPNVKNAMQEGIGCLNYCKKAIRACFCHSSPSQDKQFMMFHEEHDLHNLWRYLRVQKEDINIRDFFFTVFWEKERHWGDDLWDLELKEAKIYTGRKNDFVY